MVDLALAVAVGLLLGGVAASFLPVVPGGFLSLAGVVGYWWTTGWTEPGAAFVAVAAVLAVTAVAVDWLAGAVSAKAGGASGLTVAAAAVVGVVLFFLLTPVGALVGVLATVFALEVYRGADLEEGARVAAVTAVGMLASSAVQALLTGAVLVGFLLVVL